MPLKLNKFQEHHIYVLIILLMNLLYFYSAFLSKKELFGFNQFRHIGISGTIIFFIVMAFLIILSVRTTVQASLYPSSIPCITWKRILYYTVISTLFFFLFLSFKNEFLNQDGLALTPKFRFFIPKIGAHVTHDEMLELYLHSRFWYYTNLLFRWSVVYSYQFLSSFGGGLFIFTLLVFSTISAPEQLWKMFFLIISGGFMQLFFGDVENYTLVSVLILLYFLSGYLFIDKKIDIIIPGIILSLAMCFHLLAGWLIPSLIYLYIISAKRKQYYKIMLGAISFFLILFLILLFFHFNNLPISDLYYHSHAFGHGGNILGRIAKPSIKYYLQLINLLFLLFPSLLIFVPLFIFKRIDTCSFNIFMIVSAIFMLIFMFIWNADLGVYNDWNLFAPCAIPLSILCWYNFIHIDNLKYKRGIYTGILFTSMFHSYLWIISNHFYSRDMFLR